APTSFTVNGMTITPAPVPDVTYNYDQFGRLSTVDDGRPAQTSYGYDGMDRLTSVTDPTNNAVSYDYDPNGNLAHLTLAPAGQASQKFTNAFHSTYQVKTNPDQNKNSVVYIYNNAGCVPNINLPNGINGHYGHERNNRLKTLSYKQTNQPTLLFDYSDTD